MTAFLGVDAEPTYLERCAASVWPSPRRSRNSVTWTHEQIEEVDAVIESHPWLSGYTFDSE